NLITLRQHICGSASSPSERLKPMPGMNLKLYSACPYLSFSYFIIYPAHEREHPLSLSRYIFTISLNNIKTQQTGLQVNEAKNLTTFSSSLTAFLIVAKRSSSQIIWKREWQPTPIFVPGESHGQKSLVGYSPWGHKESDMTENQEWPDSFGRKPHGISRHTQGNGNLCLRHHSLERLIVRKQNFSSSLVPNEWSRKQKTIIKEFYSWISLELTSNYFSHSLSLASPPPKKIQKSYFEMLYIHFYILLKNEKEKTHFILFFLWAYCATLSDNYPANKLRETIEMLKAQNSAAQAAIQGALNGPDHPPKDLRIRRQHSSESVSSINSATSHSSIGSGNDADSKKKKKKNWLRSSFKQAFGKKKSTKPPSSHSDIEELTDSSLPASPKLPHNGGDCGSASMKPSQSASAICECTEAEAEIILQLKSELREKELKLTDIRLEALSSAHHLDQIREAMNRMQNEIEILKAENDRLKAETGHVAKPARPPSESASSTSSSSSRQSLGLSLNNLNVAESVTSDILLDDPGDATGHKDGRSVKIIVSISKGYSRAKDQKSQAYLIGSIGVSGKTKWDVLDGVIRRLFKEYVFRIDTSTSLGLSSDCIASYCVGDLIRSHSLEVPELLPCGYLVGDNNVITVNLKGVEENSLDSFVFDTLIPKPITQRYFNLLMEHHRIILSGPSGTGKTYLAHKLAEYVITKSGRKKTEDAIATFNVDHKSSKELQQYLANLAEQCSADNNGAELPVVIILDNLHHVGSLSDIFNGFLNCKYNKCPYIIGTMNQGVSSSPNLELHHNFRWVLCANHTEPVKGFLGRYLRRKLIEMEIERNIRNNDLVKIIDWIPKTWHHLNSFLETHSSSDVTIGPRLFLPCPMDVEGSRVWFMDLWNYSLVPYILEAVREGLQMYGKRAPWEDPSKWVLDTYPWSSASLPQEGPALLQLRPEDVGYEGCVSTKEATTSKHIPQTDTEGDPLMNMLMKLQEAANYPGTQSCDSDSTSHHEDILDSSLESTL
ncbi:hypothetical protein FD754_002857, partial [Muntiacus muntjak]